MFPVYHAQIGGSGIDTCSWNAVPDPPDLDRVARLPLTQAAATPVGSGFELKEKSELVPPQHSVQFRVPACNHETGRVSLVLGWCSTRVVLGWY